MSEITATATATAAVSTTSSGVKPEINSAALPDFNSANYEIEPSLSDDERRFYVKAFATIDMVTNRKVHCTVCRTHIGTAVNSESNLKMHPILRVTHCVKCHDFYNSGEFSKGEDGSELYCRWCGQGGEVYCCSNCPYVFCKSCIVKNLSRGVVADIEQNENWNCFHCAPKILWPLRAQHWALVNYIEAQKKSFASQNMSESELRAATAKDPSQCCRLAKSKAMSDSMESLESNASKRSQASSGSAKKAQQKSPYGQPPTKRPKTSNDEVVCTPDLLSMLEPDCQLTVAQKSRPTVTPSLTSSPRIMSVTSQQKSTPPPLVLQNTSIKMRHISPQISAQTPTGPRQTMISVRSTGPNVATSPVYHTINGFRIDLNSAALQDTFRLPNGKLIQVKRQGTTPQVQTQAQPSSSQNSPLLIRPRSLPTVQQQRPVQSTVQNHYAPNTNIPIRQYHPNPLAAAQAQIVRLGQQQHPGPATSISLPPSTTLQQVNGAQVIPGQPQRPSMTRYVFPKNPIGQARTQLQDQIFGAMELCMHLTSKVQTLTNSNAYKQARSHLEVKELYIHLSYLFTYAIGRYKGLQDKLLADMRQLGFTNDADSLENGQLAAAVDYVCYGQLNDVDLFNTGPNSFHNQVYEYRKSLHSNLKEGESEPLPPLFPLGVRAEGDPEDEVIDANENNDEWPNEELEDNDNDQVDDNFYDGGDDLEGEESTLNAYESTMDESGAAVYGTEESMTRNEQAHAFDRKLTRLLRAYPSIWCTKHTDYGNFELKRKHWRVVQSHFKRGDNLKVRWKNIRKRYVRIERRIAAGKRFNGYFDTATNFLANRNLPEEEWIDVNCGEDDGDNFERKELDAIEDTLHSNSSSKRMQESDTDNFHGRKYGAYETSSAITVRPIEVKPMDDRIINFAKSHPVLWRKSSDPQFDCIDEQTRKSLWANFWKSMPNKQASDDEENEIEIVEPKTDTITIDSDNEDEPAPATSLTSAEKNKQQKKNTHGNDSNDIDLNDFTTSILASMLEVDFTEGKTPLPGCVPPVAEARKQPRKKTTNKPNPALLQLELVRQNEIKQNDPKLKKKAVVMLHRAENTFEIAKLYCEAQKKLREKQEKTHELQIVTAMSSTQDDATAKKQTNPSVKDIIKDATDAKTLSVEKDLIDSVANYDETLLKEKSAEQTITLKPDNDNEYRTKAFSKVQADVGAGQTTSNENKIEKANVSEDKTVKVDDTKHDKRENTNQFKTRTPITTKAALKEVIDTKIVDINDDESIGSKSPEIDKTLTKTCVERRASIGNKDIVLKDNDDDDENDSLSDKDDTTAEYIKNDDEQTIDDKKSQESAERISDSIEDMKDVEMKELDAVPEASPISSPNYITEKHTKDVLKDDTPNVCDEDGKMKKLDAVAEASPPSSPNSITEKHTKEVLKDDTPNVCDEDVEMKKLDAVAEASPTSSSNSITEEHTKDVQKDDTPNVYGGEDVEMKKLDAEPEASPIDSAKCNINSTTEELTKDMHTDKTPNDSGEEVGRNPSDDVAQNLNTDKEETNFQSKKTTIEKSVLLNDLELEDILSDDSNLSTHGKIQSVAAEASTSNSQSAIVEDSSATEATSAQLVDTSLHG